MRKSGRCRNKLKVFGSTPRGIMAILSCFERWGEYRDNAAGAVGGDSSIITAAALESPVVFGVVENKAIGQDFPMKFCI